MSFSDRDRIDYPGTLAERRAALGVEVYAYCLMDDHVHLVVNPLETAAPIKTKRYLLACG